MEESMITSTQNAKVKHVVALQQKSALRRKEGLFVVEGRRELMHCIEAGYDRFRRTRSARKHPHRLSSSL